MFITFLGEGTSIYGGLAVFSVLGYMAKMRDTGVEDVVTSGPYFTCVCWHAFMWSMMCVCGLCVCTYVCVCVYVCV